LLISEDARNRFEAKAKPFFVGREVVLDTAPLYQRRDRPAKESAMTAIVKAFSNAIPAISSDLDILRTVVIFSCIGLVASLLLASYGLDLSDGFF
jgi:hypothetical protein